MNAWINYSLIEAVSVQGSWNIVYVYFSATENFEKLTFVQLPKYRFNLNKTSKDYFSNVPEN